MGIVIPVRGISKLIVMSILKGVMGILKLIFMGKSLLILLSSLFPFLIVPFYGHLETTCR